MRYGHFDDEAREYVITRPDTPLPWINYLGSEAYFGIISNTAGGYSFYRDARLRRLTRYRYNNAPLDLGGRYVYLRDDESGEYWSPSWQPTQRDLEDYSCRHGLGYSIIGSAYQGIRTETLYFVPLGENLEVWRIRVTNERPAPARLSLFSSIEWCLWEALDDNTNFQRNYSIGQVEVVDGVIYHKTEYRERRDHFAFFACSGPLAGFDTERDAFLGPYRGWDRPIAVERGKASDSIAHGWQPMGSHHVKLDLAPGETREVIVLLGYQSNPRNRKFDPPDSQTIDKKRVKPLIERYLQPSVVEKAFEDLREYWTGLLGILQVKTSNEHVDRMVNIWNAYQCMVTFNMSRSASLFESGIGRGMGFRDSNQDLLGFVHMVPARARERILDIAGTQLPSGGAYHQYQPLTKRGNDAVGSGFNDDPAWLVLAVAAYLKETGDTGILDEPVPYDSAPGTETPLYEHLQRCLQYTLDRIGPHGLPLIGRADWNDCLNLNCFSETPGESFQTTENKEGGVAESVFIGGLVALAANELAAIAGLRGDAAEERRSNETVASMKKAVETAGWDGDWFRRAYDYFGNVVGSKECDEGQIFIEPQGMCVMAGIGLENGLAGKALASVRERLATPHGIVLNQPAVHPLPPGARRDLDLPAGIQGERRRLLPHEPVGHDRRDQDGQRRGRARLLPADQPFSPRGHLRCAPLRAVRLRPDDLRQGRPGPRRGQELMAFGHRRVELRGHKPVDPGHQGRARRPAHRPGAAGGLGRLQRHAAVPRRRVCHHRPQAQGSVGTSGPPDCRWAPDRGQPRAASDPFGPGLRGRGLRRMSGARAHPGANAYGYFDEEAREYVITRPDTPTPWLNYIGEGRYGGIVSNTGGGYSFDRDPRNRRVTRYRYNAIPDDQPGRYVYLRDMETGHYWSPTAAPVKRQLESYECRHGAAYTKIASTYEGISAEVLYFVPLSPNDEPAPCELWVLRLRNAGSSTRRLRSFSYAEFSLFDAFNDMVNLDWGQHIVFSSCEEGVIRVGTKFKPLTFFLASSSQPAGYTCDREDFVGRGRDLADPIVVETGEPSNTPSPRGNSIGSLTHDIELAPGEERQIVYIMGTTERPAEIGRVVKRFSDPAEVAAALTALHDDWATYLSRFTVRTPDADMNAMLNFWNQVQCRTTLFWSRFVSGYETGLGRGMGTRDSGQDTLGTMHTVPDHARRMLTRIWEMQFADGHTWHQFFPLTGEGGPGLAAEYPDWPQWFSDDHLWLVISVCAYLRETGDFAYLEQKVPYVDSAEETVWEHMLRAVEFTLDNLGPHGLPRAGFSDWNDTLNVDHGSGKAESVWTGMQFCRTMLDLAELCEATGRPADARRFTGLHASMAGAINEHAWDGAWYMRSFDDDGLPIGVSGAAHHAIDLIAQNWCVIGRVAPTERAAQALASADERLNTEIGLALLWPPYDGVDERVCGTSTYRPRRQGERRHLLPRQHVVDRGRGDAG